MKKILIALLIAATSITFSYAQTYSEEKPALIEKVESWGEKKAFEIYKDLVLNVQDKALNVSEAMFPDPNDFMEQIDKQRELQEKYTLEFIKKYEKDGMSRNMMLYLDGYGSLDKRWCKLFKNRMC